MVQGSDGLQVSRGDPPELTQACILAQKQDSLLNGNLAYASLTHTLCYTFIDMLRTKCYHSHAIKTLANALKEVGEISKKKTSAMQNNASIKAQRVLPFVVASPLFFVVCLLSSSTAKTMGVALMLSLVAVSFIFWRKIADRITLPLIALSAFTLMNGISTQYAIAGKFALYEFLKVISAFCIAIILLAIAPGDNKRSARWIATVLETVSAIASIVSIDLLSTHFISNAVLRILNCFTADYANVAGVESGMRMTSLFTFPNVFAGCVGIGVLLSLGLVASAVNNRERTAHCVILFVNSLAFVLAFSMGATLAIGCAFLVFLFFEHSERRMNLLALMIATLVLVLISAIVISQTSFQNWTGVDVVPLSCALGGSAALALLCRSVLCPLTERRSSHGKTSLFIILGLVSAMAAYAIAAWNVTGDISLEENGRLRRAAYLDCGTYTLQIDADKPVTVMIESQDQMETMMHTSTVLYTGNATNAVFNVPRESMVVYFDFTVQERTHIRSVNYAGEEKSGSLPLDYVLLPGFVANRLQGIFANENAIQRFVFFSDGLILARRSPLIGLGMGCFENAIKSIQSFCYETKYAHNHYIQVLAETGILGLILFLSVFVVSAIFLLRGFRKREDIPLHPCLAAALTFIVIHAAIEVVFSSFSYLPLAFGVIVLIGLSCSESAPCLSVTVRSASLVGICVLSATFAVMTIGNIRAMQIVQANHTFDSLEQAAKVDRFEWADYLLTYVYHSMIEDVSDNVRTQADVYAARLSKIKSNTAPIVLAQYYFHVGNTELAFAMLEKYVSYVASDENAWNNAFHLLLQNDSGSTMYKDEASKLSAMMHAWDSEHIGTIMLDAVSQAYIEQ